MRIGIAALIITVTLFSAGCAHRNTLYLTQQLRDRIASYDIDPIKVQYFNNRTFVLQRSVNKAEAQVVKGKLKFVNGQYVERIIIKKMTPGICENYGHDFIDVSFESGEHRNIRFVLNPQGRYQISAIEWRRGYGKVEYDSAFFYIMPNGERTLLKVKKQDVFVMKKDERIAPGRSVNN